jgi:hypothetical protein
VIPDNACTLRITAAAGTELAGAYSSGTVSYGQVRHFRPTQKKFTTRSAFILHAAWLGQNSFHCPIFPTAASRRSWVRVSVPMWGFTLSRPLKIVGLVSHYHTNYLILRTPILYRLNFIRSEMLPNETMVYCPQFPKYIHQYKAC